MTTAQHERSGLVLLDFNDQHALQLVKNLNKKGVPCYSMALPDSEFSEPDLIIYGQVSDLSAIRNARELYPFTPILAVGDLRVSRTNLTDLAMMSVRWLDKDTSKRQLVTTVKNFLSGRDALVLGMTANTTLLSIAKRVDKKGNGKKIFFLPRFDATIETGFYWLSRHLGFNTFLSGGPFGAGVVVKRKFSVCLSSGAGCSLSTRQKACLHCLTGVTKFGGHLSPPEIVDQFVHTLEDTPGADNFRLPHVGLHASFMGEGEPLENVENVLSAMRILNGKYGNIAFSFSTIGVQKGIRFLLEQDLSDLSIQPQLSVHYADDRRTKFLPATVGQDNITQTLPLMLQLAKKLGHKLTVNVVIIGGPDGWQNNRAQDARNLLALCRTYDPDLSNIRFKISKFNGEGKGLQVRFRGGRSSAFVKALRRLGVVPQVVRTMGGSKDAGCGNLLTFILPAAR